MTRGMLDNSDLADINQKLPELETLWRKVNAFDPEMFSIRFPHESTIPIAGVCFQDASDSLTGARHAVHEYYAHGRWYRERRNPPLEITAIFFERYYLDDAALRLYSGGERIAKAIIAMLEISESALKPFRRSRTSEQSILAKYLSNTSIAPETVSTAVLSLGRSAEWHATIEYRNRWVHDQPPRVKGFGISYSRKKRWKSTTPGNAVLAVGGGDEPEYSIDQIAGFITSALDGFTSTLRACVDHYIEILKERGITLGQNGSLQTDLW